MIATDKQDSSRCQVYKMVVQAVCTYLIAVPEANEQTCTWMHYQRSLMHAPLSSKPFSNCTMLTLQVSKMNMNMDMTP